MNKIGKKQIKIVSLSLVLNVFFFSASSQERQIPIYNDSLKVHVFGGFFKKGEQFKFYAGDKIYLIKPSQGTNFYAFFIPIDTNMKMDDPIPLYVLRKAPNRNKFKDTGFTAYYQKDRKYFIIRREFVIKDQYSFMEHWTNVPYGRTKDEFWWDGYIPDWAKCDSIYIDTESIERRKAVENLNKRLGR